MNTQVVGFKKIKFYTMENIGSGELTLPEQEMHTTAFWLTLPRPMMEALPYNSAERLDGVNGLANALGAIATLLVMCDARDLGTSVGENAELEVIRGDTRHRADALGRALRRQAHAWWCERSSSPTSISTIPIPEAWG